EISLAREYLRQAAEIDLSNNMGNAAGGVHAAALGGLWQAMVFGFAGVEFGADGLSFDPHLLPEWKRLEFPIQWHGRKLRVITDADTLRVSVEQGDGAIALALSEGNDVSALPGQQFIAKRHGGRWQPWQLE
ncbi:MAG: hypothetical protein JOY79_02075, partial [Acidobacteriaceae bacterium]|nr:hypothetical protein [Acidobacteriaceae bacterium]